MNKFAKGIYLGITGRTSEAIVWSGSKIETSRTVRRRIAEERYDQDELTKVSVTPWGMDANEDDDFEEPLIVEEPNKQDHKHKEARQLYITKRDLNSTSRRRDALDVWHWKEGDEA